MAKHKFTSNIKFLITIVILIPLIILNSLASYKPVISNDVDYLNYLIEECENKKTTAHNLADCARKLGYDETSEIILLAKKHWNVYDSLITKYQNQIQKIKHEICIKTETEERYPIARLVWNYLKECGYNDYVCSGIIGNMMTECGGNTLDLIYNIYSPTKNYYGLCQWNRWTYDYVFDEGVEYQLTTLTDTIKEEINMFGFCYKKNFNYENFINMTNEKNVALAFAKCYERCDSSSYKSRQENATVAYDYFVIG